MSIVGGDGGRPGSGPSHSSEGLPGGMPVVFPVLVYFDLDEQAWVGISLLTCTTAVEETADEAARVVSDLLSVEVEAALDHNGGDPDHAFESMFCMADPDIWHKFWLANATPLALDSLLPPQSNRPKLDARQLAVA